MVLQKCNNNNKIIILKTSDKFTIKLINKNNNYLLLSLKVTQLKKSLL